MLPTVDDLIELNNQALMVLNGSFQTLKFSLAGQDPDEKARILARMGRINTEIQVTSNILLHLHAAGVEVDPIPQETKQQLDVLAAALDDAILRQAWIGASLDIVQQLFNTAAQMRKITEMNSSV